MLCVTFKVHYSGPTLNQRYWHMNQRSWHVNQRSWHMNQRSWHANQRSWHMNLRSWHMNHRYWHMNQRYWHMNRRYCNINQRSWHITVDIVSVIFFRLFAAFFLIFLLTTCFFGGNMANDDSVIYILARENLFHPSKICRAPNGNRSISKNAYIVRCYHIQTPDCARTIFDHNCWKSSCTRAFIKFAIDLKIADVVRRQFYLWPYHSGLNVNKPWST